MATAKFDANIRGTVSFTHIGRKTVRVKGELTGLQAGLHGMHVHMYGDVGNACMAAGAVSVQARVHAGAARDVASSSCHRR